MLTTNRAVAAALVTTAALTGCNAGSGPTTPSAAGSTTPPASATRPTGSTTPAEPGATVAGWRRLQVLGVSMQLPGAAESTVHRMPGPDVAAFRTDVGNDLFVVEVDGFKSLTARERARQFTSGKAQQALDVRLAALNPTTYHGHPAAGAEYVVRHGDGRLWVFVVTTSDRTVLATYIDRAPSSPTVPSDLARAVTTLDLGE